MNSLPKRRKPKPLGLREAPQIRCDAHLRWCRGFECLVAGKMDHVCFGKIQAHHVRKGTHTGMGQKPDDSGVVPLCATAHDEVHHGHDTFEAKYGVNLAGVARELWRVSSHGKRYREQNR